MVVYKIVAESLWREAEATGIFQGAAIDRRDGYIHLSSREQVKETAALHFKGQDNLVLVAIEAATFGNALKWEKSRGGAMFPHLYDLIDPVKILWAKPLTLSADGNHVFPDLPG